MFLISTKILHFVDSVFLGVDLIKLPQYLSVCPYVRTIRMYVRPQSFSELNEIWYVISIVVVIVSRDFELGRKLRCGLRINFSSISMKFGT